MAALRKITTLLRRIWLARKCESITLKEGEYATLGILPAVAVPLHSIIPPGSRL